MAEYIDKVAFNYAIREAVKKYPNSFYNGLEVARQIAHDFPAADVRPVVRGRWNRTDAYPHRLYCSVCYKTYLKNDELLDRWEFPLNFCPNCGAVMEES